MILKKKEFFLLIFLIFLQSCSGGRLGNFLESSFNNLEKTSKNKDKEIDDKKNKKIKKAENSKSVLENKKDINLEKEKNKSYSNKSKKTKKVEKQKNVIENEKNINSEKIPKQKSNNILNSSKKRKIKLQSYKIILILKDVDPKDPTEELNSILSNSEVNFEIEKIERILDSKNKSMTKN